MSNDESFKIGPYIIGNTLGAGVTGKVRLAFHKQTGEQVAVKIINKNILNKPDVAHKLQREIAVMNLIEHKNVLNLYDYYESPEHLYLVLEYAQNGDLYDYLIEKSPLDSKDALVIFQQIIEGLDFCHKHFVCHRDLKPENILLDSDNNIKLADFGMCAFRPDNILCKTSCGSPHYASPEVVSGKEYDGRKADIWSCGVILYALLVGKLPFDDPEIVKVLDKIKLGDYELPEFLPSDVRSILSRILSVDPSTRITIDEIRLHPWYTSNQYISEPIPPLSPIAEVPDLSVKEDILQTISELGLGDLAEVKQKIAEDGENYAKTYYKVLDERKKRRAARDLNKKTLKRAKSEAGLKLTKALRSSGGGSASKSGSGKLLKRTSLAKIEEADVTGSRATPTRGNTTPLQPSLTSSANNKRSKFLSFWFGSSDSHLKKISTCELTDGVASHKPIGELTNDIESALESIGSTYTFTNKRDRIKAQVTKESKNIKFSITISLVVDPKEKEKDKEKDKDKDKLEREPIYFLSFSRRAGSKEIYNEICNSIKRMLNAK